MINTMGFKKQKQGHVIETTWIKGLIERLEASALLIVVGEDLSVRMTSDLFRQTEGKRLGKPRGS